MPFLNCMNLDILRNNSNYYYKFYVDKRINNKDQYDKL